MPKIAAIRWRKYARRYFASNAPTTRAILGFALQAGSGLKTGNYTMKTKVSRAGVALVALLATAGTAVAEGEWSGNVAITSDYVWRGISQTDEDPAIQGGFDYANGMFYAGTWASNVDFGDDSDTNIEVDFYGGLAGALESGVTWDVGVIY